MVLNCCCGHTYATKHDIAAKCGLNCSCDAVVETSKTLMLLTTI